MGKLNELPAFDVFKSTIKIHRKTHGKTHGKSGDVTGINPDLVSDWC